MPQAEASQVNWKTAAMLVAVFSLGVATTLAVTREQNSGEPAGRAQVVSAAAEAALETPAPESVKAREAQPDSSTARTARAPEHRHALDLQGIPILGESSAPMSLVVFTDFACPFCSRLKGTLDQVRRDYPNQVKIAFRHLPTKPEARSSVAHLAAIAAERQGSFWQMHDLILENPRKLTRLQMIENARALGLNMRSFEADLEDESLASVMDRDRLEADRLGVSRPPTLFLNGKMIRGAQPYANLRAFIEMEIGRLAIKSESESVPGSKIRNWVATSREQRSARRAPGDLR